MSVMARKYESAIGHSLLLSKVENKREDILNRK